MCSYPTIIRSVWAFATRATPGSGEVGLPLVSAQRAASQLRPCSVGDTRMQMNPSRCKFCIPTLYGVWSFENRTSSVHVY